MRFCKSFSFAMSIAMTLAIVIQNITSVYADQNSNDGVATEKPIYHIALTPWESRSLGIDHLDVAMREYAENLERTESYQKAMGNVIILSAAGASVYYLWTSAHEWIPTEGSNRFQDLMSRLDRQLFRGQMPYSGLEEFIYKLSMYIIPLIDDEFDSSRARAMSSGLAKDLGIKSAFLVSGALLGSLVSLPLVWLDDVLIQKWTFPTEKLDRNKLKEAFTIAQSHAHESCRAFNGYKAKTVQHSSLQSMHFTEEDFNQGRVYVDGKPLSKEDFFRYTGSKDTLAEMFFVFKTDEVRCKTGYFTSTPLSELMAAVR